MTNLPFHENALSPQTMLYILIDEDCLPFFKIDLFNQENIFLEMFSSITKSNKCQKFTNNTYFSLKDAIIPFTKLNK